MGWISLLLLLAPGVLANLDTFPIDRVGPIEAADVDSCRAGASVLSVCAARTDFPDMPVASQAKCACCVGTSNVASEYRGCATYLRTALPSETALYTTNLLLASACSVNSALCADSATAPPAGSATGTPTTTSTRRSTTTAPQDPAACSSLRSILTSCSKAVPSFFDAPGSSQASCVCYNTIGGTFTTAFDRFASSCASYYRTASPTLYSTIRSLSTFCSGRQDAAAETDRGNPWFPPDMTSASPDVTTTPPPSFSGTTTVTSLGAGSTSTSSAQAGRPIAASGPVGWIASSWTFLVSLFILV
ncbi:hypothetical protein GGTG_02792 [Gaeumannomyces tritici R3-111a-1]|uniref:Extracellular membrane protein CFEM domain-containing protein n=1 Tax=Gaeumannomyces tritici (strain R3-111a-1) TaxID=644352 RepID=J3NND6_GAET3|nr:hypothetical protein GGTG_02792 [Gaeumannomyces tritici R3-111a-1]EJT77688.1 hypothetical protein GGTG_02792 [Gaeumannomyces tritici R3-111a-1]